jgi:hypothetical protein
MQYDLRPGVAAVARILGVDYRIEHPRRAGRDGRTSILGDTPSVFKSIPAIRAPTP